ncbi:hypothetical protein FC83_GL002698 [Agrilactobacillus composti DSM 18527 = JCM 14202]|jgi:uncharacterized membrane protein|uniref:SHOCT domain-containing protein n=2 Tax=Agrilactobacillus TaxID=2767875 RepID=X0PQ60_9LACO|nr:hypothetical protein FC83_GL002698 [Agrilactobacillus composti DSM 18527 = JCM 14202]GAF39186.1 hypothetical protein JCM14202_1031 [Agrilactobacillus composti DSM 18527 = JCM 14202]
MALQQGLFSGFGFNPYFFLMSLVLGAFLLVVLNRLHRQRVSAKINDLQRMLDLLDDAYHEGRIDKSTYLRQRNQLLNSNR